MHFSGLLEAALSKLLIRAKSDVISLYFILIKINETTRILTWVLAEEEEQYIYQIIRFNIVAKRFNRWVFISERNNKLLSKNSYSEIWENIVLLRWRKLKLS